MSKFSHETLIKLAESVRHAFPSLPQRDVERAVYEIAYAAFITFVDALDDPSVTGTTWERPEVVAEFPGGWDPYLRCPNLDLKPEADSWIERLDVEAKILAMLSSDLAGHDGPVAIGRWSHLGDELLLAPALSEELETEIARLPKKKRQQEREKYLVRLCKPFPIGGDEGIRFFDDESGVRGSLHLNVSPMTIPYEQHREYFPVHVELKLDRPTGDLTKEQRFGVIRWIGASLRTAIKTRGGMMHDNIPTLPTGQPDSVSLAAETISGAWRARPFDPTSAPGEPIQAVIDAVRTVVMDWDGKNWDTVYVALSDLAGLSDEKIRAMTLSQMHQRFMLLKNPMITRMGGVGQTTSTEMTIRRPERTSWAAADFPGNAARLADEWRRFGESEPISCEYAEWYGDAAKNPQPVPWRHGCDIQSMGAHPRVILTQRPHSSEFEPGVRAYACIAATEDQNANKRALRRIQTLADQAVALLGLRRHENGRDSALTVWITHLCRQHGIMWWRWFGDVLVRDNARIEDPNKPTGARFTTIDDVARASAEAIEGFAAGLVEPATDGDRSSWPTKADLRDAVPISDDTLRTMLKEADLFSGKRGAQARKERFSPEAVLKLRRHVLEGTYIDRARIYWAWEKWSAPDPDAGTAPQKPSRK